MDQNAHEFTPSPPARRALPAMAPRYALQATFFLFYVYLGWSLWSWAAAAIGGLPPATPRPAAVDGFLPISGLMGLRHWLTSGSLHPVHPAAALIFLAACLSGLLLKRSFCSWICPVFPISEGLWRLGRRLFGRNFAPPFWLDLLLRLPKYLLLGFFLWQVLWLMPFEGVRAFLDSAYHRSADLRMLQFFLEPSTVLLATLAFFAVVGLFVQMPWCRYLCPYGALLGILSLLSAVRVVRNPQRCVRCGACSARCPAWLPVMILRRVRSAECYACLRCVQGCPAAGALELKLLGRWHVAPLLFGTALLLLFVGVDLYGRAVGRWHTAPPGVVRAE